MSNDKLREALEMIAAIEDSRNGGDWNELNFKKAKGIARAALSKPASAPATVDVQHGELHPDVARSSARSALGYSEAFNGRKIDWQSDEPWPHRIELAQALDWITDLGAMVLNLADRVATPTQSASTAERDAALSDELIDKESLRYIERSGYRLDEIATQQRVHFAFKAGAEFARAAIDAAMKGRT